MGKLRVNQILVKNANLTSNKLSANASVIKLIKDTKQKQLEVLKLKEADQQLLRMVVQF